MQFAGLQEGPRHFIRCFYSGSTPPNHFEFACSRIWFLSLFLLLLLLLLLLPTFTFIPVLIPCLCGCRVSLFTYTLLLLIVIRFILEPSHPPAHNSSQLARIPPPSISRLRRNEPKAYFLLSETLVSCDFCHLKILRVPCGVESPGL